MNLCPFDGNYINWLNFWDTFKASIYDSTELSDVVKFTYLVSLLRGSAKEVITGLSLTSANYKDAQGRRRGSGQSGHGRTNYFEPHNNT